MAADEPLPFSTLRDRVGERDAGRFILPDRTI